MNKYEKLLDYFDDAIIVKEMNLVSCKGYYNNGIIFINEKLNADEKYIVLLEELYHHKYNVGQNDIKQEKLVRTNVYQQICPIEELYNLLLENEFISMELIENHFSIDQSYLEDILLCYKSIYGNPYKYKNHYIYFFPLKLVPAKNYIYEY